MDYKVLYRKYRPQNFDEVVGQDNTIRLLKDSVENNKISHAYIFSGPRGTGKTSTAKIFAKAINCSHNVNGNPCNECEMCINYKTSSDIYEIDAASNNGVDQIREIIDNIKLTPVSSKYKVYIIDEVHMLSSSAFNALLLTLEEPPSHVVFILATTNIESVPITILSRCQRMDFKKISFETMCNKLKDVSKSEKINITDEAISEIAYCADGGLRDALSILDQLSKEKNKITDEVVLKSIGVISNKGVIDLINNLEDGKINEIIDFVNNARELATDYKSLIKKIIDNITNKCIDIKKNRIFSKIGYQNYKNICFELTNTLYKANVSIDSYTMLELILLEYIDNDNMEHEKLEIPHRIESKLSHNVDKKESKEESIDENYFPGNNLELVDIRVNNCFSAAKKTKLVENKPKWAEFVGNNTNKTLKGLLLDTDIVLASENIMVVKTELEENAQLINDKLDEISVDYCKKYESEYSFIAVSNEYWEQKMEEYKKNKANGIKYKIMDEPKIEKDTAILKDVFSMNKVEVK